MLIKHTKEIIYVQIDFQNIEFQYLLLQNLGVVIQLKLSYHFASNSFIVLILGSLSVFISVVSEHHDNLVRTENFSFGLICSFRNVCSSKLHKHIFCMSL